MKNGGLRYDGMGPSTEIDFTLMLRARLGDGFRPRRALVTVAIGSMAGAIGDEHVEENS